MRRALFALLLLCLAPFARAQSAYSGPFVLPLASVSNPYFTWANPYTVKCNPTGILGAIQDCPYSDLGVPPFGITALYSTTNVASAASPPGTLVTTPVTLFTTVTAGQAGELPTAAAGLYIVVCDGTSTALLVYPNTGDAINTGGANNPVTVPGNACAEFWAITAGKWGAIIYTPTGTGVAKNVGSGVNSATSVSTSLVSVGFGTSTWGGNAWLFTPATSGRILVNANVVVTTQTAIANFQVQLYCGAVGSGAPANGVAPTGTGLGVLTQTKAPAVATGASVPLTGIYFGTVGVPSYCDVAYDTTNASDAVFIQSNNATFVETP